MKQLVGIFLAIVMLLGIVGCGGGGESSSVTNTKNGVIYDSSYIEGLGYRTSSGITGETNNNGEFKYNQGDLIEFYLGNIKLDKIVAKKSISTLDFNNSIQLTQFFQTIDSDSIPQNAIMINSDTVKKAMEYNISLHEVAIDSAYYTNMVKSISGKQNLVNYFTSYQNTSLFYERKDLESYADNTTRSKRRTANTSSAKFKRQLANFAYGNINTNNLPESIANDRRKRIMYLIYGELYLPISMAESHAYYLKYKDQADKNEAIHATTKAIGSALTIVGGVKSLKNIPNLGNTEYVAESIKTVSQFSNMAISEAFGEMATQQITKSPVFKKVATEVADGINTFIQGAANPAEAIPGLILKTQDIIADFMTSYNISDIMRKWNSYRIASAMVKDEYMHNIIVVPTKEIADKYAKEISVSHTKFLGIFENDDVYNYDLSFVKENFYSALSQNETFYNYLNKIYQFDTFYGKNDTKKKHADDIFKSLEFRYEFTDLDGFMDDEKEYGLKTCYSVKNTTYTKVDKLYVTLKTYLPTRDHKHDTIISQGVGNAEETVFSIPTLAPSGEDGDSHERCYKIVVPKNKLDRSDYCKNNYTACYGEGAFFVIDMAFKHKDLTQEKMEDIIVVDSHDSKNYPLVTNSESEISSILEEDKVLSFNINKNTLMGEYAATVDTSYNSDYFGKLTYTWKQISGPTVQFKTNYSGDVLSFKKPKVQDNSNELLIGFELKLSTERNYSVKRKKIFFKIKNNNTYFLSYKSETLKDNTIVNPDSKYRKVWTITNSSNITLKNVSLKETLSKTNLNNTKITPTIIKSWQPGVNIKFTTDISVPKSKFLKQNIHKKNWIFSVDGKSIPYKNGVHRAYLSYTLKTEVQNKPNDEIINPEEEIIDNPVPEDEEEEETALPISTVTGISPTKAILYEPTKFTISGTNLPRTLKGSLHDSLENSCRQISHSPTKVVFTCTPGDTGIKEFYLRDTADSVELQKEKLLVNVNAQDICKFTKNADGLARALFKLSTSGTLNNPGYVTAPYLMEGYSQYIAGMDVHAGIDYRASIGKPIYSVVSGRVVKSENGYGYGMVGIQTKDNDSNTVLFSYAHLKSTSLNEGDDVKVGDLIGYTGSTGAKAAHLHVEYRTNYTSSYLVGPKSCTNEQCSKSNIVSLTRNPVEIFKLACGEDITIESEPQNPVKPNPENEPKPRAFNKLMKTNQTQCYDWESATPVTCTKEHKGQDGYYKRGINSSLSRASGEDILSDSTTRLMWSDESVSGDKSVNWAQANEYCKKLSIGGFDDWLLPSSKELLSIRDYGSGDKMKNPKFANIGDGYWARDSYTKNSSNAWYVTFGNKNSSFVSKKGALLTRCVRYLDK